MEGIWLQNNTLTYRTNLAIPEIGAGEALVKVRLAGICGTDLELVDGYCPFTGIPGHEFVGEIVRAPSHPQREGQRVVGEINIACGSWRMCVAGRSKHCESRRVLGIRDWNGAFAEYLSLPLANLIPVPDSVSDEAAVFTEPLAAALNIQEQIRNHCIEKHIPGRAASQPLSHGRGRDHPGGIALRFVRAGAAAAAKTAVGSTDADRRALPAARRPRGFQAGGATRCIEDRYQQRVMTADY